MSSNRIAVRYAKPLLDLAVEKGLLEEVKADMDNFAGICREDRQFVAMLKSPIIPHLKKAEILEKIFKGKVSDLTNSIFNIITRKNREGLLPNVAEQFQRLYNEKKGLQEATVTTTFSLDDDTRNAVHKMVSDISGKEPLVAEEIDPDIVGGYILELGDRQIDESIRGQLAELRLKFKKDNN